MNNIKTATKENLKVAKETRLLLLATLASISGGEPNKDADDDKSRMDSIESDMEYLAEILMSSIDIATMLRNKICGEPDTKSCCCT